MDKRTNVVLDEDLVTEALKLTGARSKRDLLDLALRELIDRRRRLEALHEFEGRVTFDEKFLAERSLAERSRQSSS